MEDIETKHPMNSVIEFKKLSEHDQDALLSFLDYMTVRLEEISYQLRELKSFIENDGYAKENAETFKLFFDDINKLADLAEHIYDNMPV